jgi:hypothetical protein
MVDRGARRGSMTRRIAKSVMRSLLVTGVLACAVGCDDDLEAARERASHATRSGNSPTDDSRQGNSPTDVVPADDLPPPDEPQLANEGDWAADFNDAQISCYQGSMSACDSIWLSERVLMDTFLYEYGYLCGGRIRADAGSSQRYRYRTYGTAKCVEIFPGHE